MSSESLPITPARFAAALADLPPAALRLKALELHNSLAHLAYSNAQLRPFAEGLGPAAGAPDPDCADAIRENELVMARMRERVLLVRAEAERRGLAWRDVAAAGGVPLGPLPGGGADDDDEEEEEEEAAAVGGLPAANGRTPGGAAAGSSGSPPGPAATTAAPARGNPWADGTFQTGVIRNGEVHMDAVPGQRGAGTGTGAETTTTATTTTTGSAGGGRLTDEELRRMLEERLAEEGGLQL